QPAAGRDGCVGDGFRHPHGACPVVPGDAFSGMARLTARSCRGIALRMSGEASILELKQVGRHYQQGLRQLTILDGADFTLKAGEMVALVAPSGTGKSTLLHIAGLLERPDAGEVIIAGQASGRLSDDERTAIRRNEIGFVYQFHHLLPEFSALENIMMPQLVCGLPQTQARERALQLLDYMKIGERAEHRPTELSGGEQQRVAIARAVAN